MYLYHLNVSDTNKQKLYVNIYQKTEISKIPNTIELNFFCVQKKDRNKLPALMRFFYRVGSRGNLSHQTFISFLARHFQNFTPFLSNKATVLSPFKRMGFLSRFLFHFLKHIFTSHKQEFAIIPSLIVSSNKAYWWYKLRK